MIDFHGKRLLILGDTSTADVILNAKSMGVYTIVSGIHPEAKTRQLADEAVLIPSDDHEALARFIRENKIDGVMTGASEFQICQMIQLCHKVGLPVYANEIQWHLCQDKACFKKLCREFNVPVVPEFEIDSEMKQADLTRIEYPVVVKPTDSCSSQGLSICFNENELRIAIPIAVSVSKSGRFLVEKCIISDNGFGCRYIVNNGEIYLSAVNDRYTVDKLDGCAHFGAVSRFPSKRIDSFINEINPSIVRMFQSIGLANGTFFMQALIDPNDNQMYFHDMGLRLSGGLFYHMFEAACGYNDIQMMIRYALGGPMATSQDIERIDPRMKGHIVGGVTIPLKSGVIASITGIEDVRRCSQVVGITQYYSVGDEVKDSFMGTLSQLLCRVKILTDSSAEFCEVISFVQNTIKVEDADGHDLVYRRFDISRLT